MDERQAKIDKQQAYNSDENSEKISERAKPFIDEQQGKSKNR